MIEDIIETIVKYIDNPNKVILISGAFYTPPEKFKPNKNFSYCLNTWTVLLE